MLYLLNVMKHIAVNWPDLSSFSWAGDDGDTSPKGFKHTKLPSNVYQYFFGYGLRDGSGEIYNVYSTFKYTTCK